MTIEFKLALARIRNLETQLAIIIVEQLNKIVRGE